MFRQSSIKHSSQNIPNSSSWQKMVVELDEGNEESLSGGLNTTLQKNPDKDAGSQLVIALVLLFANPFA